MLLRDVLRATRASAKGYAGLPEMNPLTESDALQEAQLLDLQLDAARGQLGLLFELRMALQLREPNTGVLVARGIRELSWTAPTRSTSPTSWSVGGSKVDNQDGLFRLELGLWPAPGAKLIVIAESAAFIAGHVAGLADAPPDYSDEDAKVRDLVPSWHSTFVPSSAVFVDPGGAS